MHDALNEFLVDKLDVHQHGFAKIRSILTNLTHYVDYFSCNLDGIKKSPSNRSTLILSVRGDPQLMFKFFSKNK